MPKSIKNSTNNLTTGEAKLLVLLIGVNQYQDDNLHDLQYCAKDSRKLAEAIENAALGFPKKQIVCYDDYAPSKPILNNVVRGLDNLVKAAGKLDTILVYFSGHGVLDTETQEPFLCLADTRLGNGQDACSTGLQVKTLLAKLAESGAKYQLLFLDACHSGGLSFQDLLARTKEGENIQDRPVNPTPELINILQERASKSKGFYALLSCDKNQQSLEFRELEHGLFTYYLIRGFLGEAADERGVITADALYQYVYRETLAFIDKNNYQIKLINQQKRSRGEEEQKPYDLQVPRRIVEGTGEFILGFLPAVARENNLGKNHRLGLIVNAVSDCEEVVNLVKNLSSRGGFEMDYFSGRDRSWQDARAAMKRCLGVARPGKFSDSDVAGAEGQKSVRRSLRDTTTAFLYIRARMETAPEGESYLLLGEGVRLSRTVLRQLLRNSKMRRVAIALDCPDASQRALDEWVEDLRGEKVGSFCLLAVAPKGENSTEFAAALGGVLANAKGGFTVAEAIAELQREMRDSATTLPPPFSRGAGGDPIPNSPFPVWLSGGAIELLLPEGKGGVIFDSGIPPYKGLLAFTKKDAFFFHGRETLAQEIVARLQRESFLAVVGASGSGKSSVVQAGVLPLLEAGTQLPGKCWTGCFRPGKEPIKALARVLASSEAEAKRVEGSLHLGVDNFVWELQQRQEPTVVLAIDQFEELFTFAEESERREFLGLLLGALARMPQGLKAIVTLRDDFIAACLEVPELAERVRGSFLLVPPGLREEEYGRAIVEPARKVGLTVEEGLVEVLLEEVRQGAGALPLLQFALQRLWECRQGARLTLQSYQERVGGLKGVLEKRANEVLNGLNEEERSCARWILVSLVHLGEGREDTRRRVLRSELFVDKYDKKAMELVLRKLIEARLVSVGSPLTPLEKGGTGGGSPLTPLEKGGTGEGETVQSKAPLAKGGLGGSHKSDSHFKAPLAKGGLGGSHKSNSPTQIDLEGLEVSVEIAHEILIRHWSTLRWWLDENRGRLQLQREIEQRGKQWRRHGKDEGYLAKGAELTRALELYVNDREELSSPTREFIEAGIELQGREERERRLLRRRTIWGLVGGLVAVSLFAAGAVWQWWRAVVGERNAVISARIATLESFPPSSLKRQLDVIALGKELGEDWVSLENRVRGILLLVQTFDLQQWKERKTLEGHKKQVVYVNFSPDGNFIASASFDHTVRLWKPDGKLVAILEGHKDEVNYVSFSPDGKLLASAGKDKTVRLWKPDGTAVAALEGHQDELWHVSFSPDGKLLASASDDKTVRLWKADGTALATLEGHTDYVRCVSFSPDGKLLASASWDNTVRLWKADGTALATLEGHTDDVRHVSFSPDGKLLASASEDDTVRLWKLDGTAVATLEGHQGWISYISFSPDGKLLASASGDGTARIWKPDGTVVATLRGHQDGVFHVSFSPDGKLIATASLDNTVRLWKPDGTAVATLGGHRDRVWYVNFSPDGKLLASASNDDTVRLWKPDGTALATLEGHRDPVRHVSFSPDGKLLASAGKDKTVRLWKPDGTALATLEGHRDRVRHVSFSPDGKLLASASDDKTIRLWKPDGTAVATLEGHRDRVRHVSFSPDGKLLASASDDKTIRLWKPDGTAVATLEGHLDWVFHISFSPDGKLLASASGDNTIRLWKPDGTAVGTLEGHRDWVFHISFSPDGKLLASASDDKTIRLWKPDGTAVATLEGHLDWVFHISFSPDGKLLASASGDNTIRLWKPDGTAVATLEGHRDWVFHVSFSPDGKLLASASDDNTIRLWKPDGTAVATLERHRDWVRHVSFSPDGKLLASASDDNTVRLWNLDRDSLLKQACDWMGNYLTNNPNVSKEEKRLCN